MLLKTFKIARIKIVTDYYNYYFCIIMRFYEYFKSKLKTTKTKLNSAFKRIKPRWLYHSEDTLYNVYVYNRILCLSSDCVLCLYAYSYVVLHSVSPPRRKVMLHGHACGHAGRVKNERSPPALYFMRLRRIFTI